MIKIVVVGLLTLVSLAAGAESMEWNFESRSPYRAQLSFYSNVNNRQWPGGGKAYTLNEWKDYQYVLSCIPGEKICFGASSSPNGQHSWGVGLHNNKGCTACCVTCGAGPTKMVLTPP